MSLPSTSSTAPNRSRSSARIIAQTSVDAKLDAEFNEMGSSFDYSHTVAAMQKVQKVSSEYPSSTNVPRSEGVMAYLQHIQKGKLIQPFGCLLAVNEQSFKVVAFSENAREMLTMGNLQVPGDADDSPSLAIGTDVRTLFTSSSAGALQKALGFAEVHLLNPILVNCKASGKPFYAIVHRVTGCTIMDFEPVNLSEVPKTAAGALQSYKLVAKAITKLQSLPGGSMERLCDTVVREVFELTGYDRVMTYKFHKDDHGEVLAEITKPGLEPYLGLHYPATDIPQAARFLFMRTKVRMICDCRVKPAKVYQDERLPFEIISCGSTLRAPHSCHLQYMKNMNSIASLVMAVVVNEGEEDDQHTDRGPPQQRTRLWGLVVCHHQSPRFIPFPRRYACQFLMQVFAVHVMRELELENQIREKNILRTQTLLSDVLLRYADPISVIVRSPNIMDLVKCDGAALLYKNRIWQLGLAPTDSEIRDLAIWLSERHMDSNGFCTDSLYDAGYPAALALGDTVCGMAAARVTSKDFLFWFRSHTAAEVRWGGAKHYPSDEDDAKRMQPRSSFRAFLDVMKMKSLPWNDYEMDAIHSLQLILRRRFNERKDISNDASLDSRFSNLKLEGTVDLQVVRNEMVRLVETARVPILTVDVDCLVSGWNMKIAELTGLSISQALGRHLLTLVEDCSTDIVRKMVYFALQGNEEKGVQFQLKTHGPRVDDGPVILLVNACASRDLQKNVVGACFIAQDMTSHKMVMDKFTRMEGDYKAIVQNPNPLIPPIFGADEFGWCSEWNPAMSKFSGWGRDEVIDKMLLGEVFGTNVACCRLRTLDTFVKFSIIINNAMMGQDTEKASFAFINRNGKHVDCLFSVYRKVDGEGVVTGVYCFLHVTSQELHPVFHTQQQFERTKMKRLKALTYIRHAIRSPLSGITHSRKMLESTNLSEEQKQLVSTWGQCQLQLNSILNDLELENIMDSCMHLEMVEFALHNVVVTAISQVMTASERKGVEIINNLNGEFMTEVIYGDSVRLQQIVANYLLVSVKFSPSGGQVEITASLIKDLLGETLHLLHLELRISHSGREAPAKLLSEMFGSSKDPSAEGLSLLVCRKLLRMMNGGVRYLNEAGKSTFIITAELASASNLEA